MKSKKVNLSAIWVATAILLTTFSSAGAAPTGQAFATPLLAVDAAVSAVRENDEEALIKIFGEAYRDMIDTADDAGQRERRKAFYAQVKQKLTLLSGDDGKISLLVGNDDWPMPIPLVRGAEGWQFDTAEGAEEILRRRFGMNEIAAMEAIDAVVDAQLRYVQTDWDKDTVFEFAQKFVAEPNKKNGLFWEKGKDGKVSPLAEFVEDAEPFLAGRKPGDPFRGYHFRIVHRQGASAPGEAAEYIVNGNLVGGYGIVAYPAEYGVTGIMSFKSNHLGQVYEKDLGEKTTELAQGIDNFDPAEGWNLSDF